MSPHTTRMHHPLQASCQLNGGGGELGRQTGIDANISASSVILAANGQALYMMLSAERGVAGQTYFMHNILNAQDTELQQHEATVQSAMLVRERYERQRTKLVIAVVAGCERPELRNLVFG